MLSDSDLISAYMQVFQLQGGLVLTEKSPPVNYILSQINVLLNHNSTTIDFLNVTRHLSDPDLLRILFQAVAGNFVAAGTSALGTEACKITADPVTGYLAAQDNMYQNKIVLTVISIILFVVIGFTFYQQQ